MIDEYVQLTPAGRLAALLHRRFGISVLDAADVWDVWSKLCTDAALADKPGASAVAVVLVGGGELIPVFPAEEPGIEEASDE